MTSFPERIAQVHLVIASILTQSVSPERIILFLAEADFPDRVLPRSLASLPPERLEVRFVQSDLKQYLKLVPALRAFPGTPLVTCDDDCFYRQGWFAALRAAAAATPEMIVCCRSRTIRQEPEGGFATYLDWPENAGGSASFWLLPLGIGGVWYPPGALHPDVTDDTLFMSMAPTGDDLWFKIMSLRAGVPCRRVEPRGKNSVRPYYADDRMLSETNVLRGENDRQFAVLTARYKIDLAAIATLEATLDAPRAPA